MFFGRRVKRDRSKNVTCVQNAQFYLTFTEAGEWRRREKSPCQAFVRLEKASPEDVRQLKTYTAERMERVAQMMEVLLAMHDDWAITAHRDYVKMETVTLDFKDAIAALQAHGFTEDDYLLQAEYTRKWGMI
ncbi:hypothetical protein ACKQTC_04505 [Peptococcus simiae]|uniref:Uncharacterized protein n=1 Tax=Peptococcus simiae TaxID=1643805 RepID=A0ABW9GYE6_9FIRM